MIEIMVRLKIEALKIGGLVSLEPVSIDDEKSMKSIGNSVYKAKLTRQSNRSLIHHQLYWCGLIGLMRDYWEPAAGCITPNEEGILETFSEYLSAKGGVDAEALETVRTAYIEDLKRLRAWKHEAPSVQDETIHRWIKEEVGMYELYLTPSGWRKKLGSINFNAMTQDGFNEFYKEAFNVAWKFVLSRSFEFEGEAQDAINKLVEMG